MQDVNTVVEHMSDGRTRVAFETGEEHRYEPASLHEILGTRPRKPPSEPGKGKLVRKTAVEQKMSMSVRDLQASLDAANGADDRVRSEASLQTARAKKRRERLREYAAEMDNIRRFRPFACWDHVFPQASAVKLATVCSARSPCEIVSSGR